MAGTGRKQVETQAQGPLPRTHATSVVKVSGNRGTRGEGGADFTRGRGRGEAEVGPPERQLGPDGQVAGFIVSGKQMTERKPSAGMGNAGRVQIWVTTGGKPLPQARGLPPPRMRPPRGFRGAGEGAAAGRAPRRKTRSPPTGLGSTLRDPPPNMQIYVNRHANKQHLFASTACLGTFPGRRRRVRSSGAPGWACGGRSGVRERFQRGRGKAARLPALSAGAGQAGAETGAPRAHEAASRRAAPST